MEIDELRKWLVQFQGDMMVAKEAGEEEFHNQYVKITRFIIQQIKEKTVCSQQTA